MTDNASRGLGRVEQHDPRNWKLSRVSPLMAGAFTPTTKRWPMFVRPLDQGSTSTCVGHGGKHWMLLAPVIRTTPMREPTAITLYRETTALDAWHGGRPDETLQDGTSVLALMKAFAVRGVVGSYAFADNVEEIIRWLCVGGPVVLGLAWYPSLFNTDDAGVFQMLGPNERVIGGHCITLSGWDNKRGLFEGINSWGSTFGKLRADGSRDGRFRMPAELLRRLLTEDGEASTALEVST